MLLVAKMAFLGMSGYKVKEKLPDGTYRETDQTAVVGHFVAYNSDGKPDYRAYRIDGADGTPADIQLFDIYTVKLDSNSGKNGDYMRLVGFGKKWFSAKPEFTKQFADICNSVD